MSDESSRFFWLPVLSAADDTVLPLSVAPGTPLPPWSGNTKADLHFVEQLLRDLGPLLMAYQLAGYDVPWLNLAVPDEMFEWLRIDLVRRWVEIVPRPYAHSFTHTALELRTEPRWSGLTSTAIPIDSKREFYAWDVPSTTGMTAQIYWESETSSKSRILRDIKSYLSGALDDAKIALFLRWEAREEAARNQAGYTLDPADPDPCGLLWMLEPERWTEPEAVPSAEEDVILDVVRRIRDGLAVPVSGSDEPYGFPAFLEDQLAATARVGRSPKYKATLREVLRTFVPDLSRGDSSSLASTFFNSFDPLVEGSRRDRFVSKSEGRALERRPYVEVVMHMAEWGLFPFPGLQGLVTQLSVEGEVIEARHRQSGTDADGFAIRDENVLDLNLPDYEDAKLTLELESDLGYSFRQSCCWEYIEATAEWSSQLIVVVAPGVAIRGRISWPASCPITVYRVQSHALVPPWGTRIDTAVLEAPIPIYADWGDEGVEPDTDAEQVEERPVMLVKPIRDVEGQRSGVQISYPAEHLPTMKKDAFKLDIYVSEHSGSERFAYHVEPYKQIRVVEMDLDGQTRVITEETIKYRVIVHYTAGVDITLEDSDTWVTDPPADYFWYRGESLDDILPQGAELEYRLGDLTWASADPLEILSYRPSSIDLNVPTVSIPAVTNGSVTWSTPTSILAGQKKIVFDVMATIGDVVIGVIPVVGDAADLTELVLSFAVGTDKWGRPVDNFDRLMMVGGVMLPFVSSGALRGLRVATDAMVIVE